MKNNPRFQQIKYTKNGDAFVTFHGIRHNLSDFMRFDEPTPYFRSFHKGKPTINAHGYKSVSNVCTLLIEIDENGESAKLCLNF